MTNYQQTGKFVFEMKDINTKYHLNKRVKKVGNINSTEMLDSTTKSISIAN